MWLLTPAGKVLNGAPQPQQGDHFVCYKVEPPKPFQVDLSFQDQFDVHFKKSEKVAELTPDYFCMPVRKKRKEKPEEEGINNADTHLALYAFKPDQVPADRVHGRSVQEAQARGGAERVAGRAVDQAFETGGDDGTAVLIRRCAMAAAAIC